MTVELVDDYIRLQQLIPAWTGLAETSSWPNVFYEPWYLLEAAAAFEQKITHGFVWCESSPDKLIGYLPLCVAVRSGRVRPRLVENWHHDFCFSGQPLISQGRELEFWDQLMNHIDQTPALGRTLRLRGQKREGASFDALETILCEQQRWYRIYRQFNRAVLHHAGGADAYLQIQLTKKKRKEYRRQRRRLAEVGELREETLTQLEDLNMWIDQFLALEQSGWKGEDETAMASSQASTEFFRNVCQAAFSADKLEIARLSLDGEPIAMLVTFLARPFGNFTFKISFDEAFAKYSPGVLLELNYLERVLGDGSSSEGWSDSCAAEDHPMINKLWRDRLELCSIKISPKRPIARLASIYDDVFSRLANRFKK